MPDHRRKYALLGLAVMLLPWASTAALPATRSAPPSQWAGQFHPYSAYPSPTTYYGWGGRDPPAGGSTGGRYRCSEAPLRDWFISPWHRCGASGTIRPPPGSQRMPSGSHHPSSGDNHYVLPLVASGVGIGLIGLGMHHTRRRWRHKPPPSVSITLGMDVGHVRIVRRAAA